MTSQRPVSFVWLRSISIQVFFLSSDLDTEVGQPPLILSKALSSLSLSP
ncbi:hypothetical protein [Thermococcus zilligii]|nr:hypothetical protein [Thermococcus zilligii]